MVVPSLPGNRGATYRVPAHLLKALRPVVPAVLGVG